jgi:hypothetical protein
MEKDHLETLMKRSLTLPEQQTTDLLEKEKMKAAQNPISKIVLKDLIVLWRCAAEKQPHLKKMMV